MTDKAAEAGKAAAAVLKGGFNITVVQAIKYAIHLVLAFLVAWALRHGIHVSVDYIGLSALTFFGPMLAKLVIHDLGFAWQAGKSAGEYHQAKQTLTAELTQRLSSVSSDDLTGFITNLQKVSAKTPSASPYL